MTGRQLVVFAVILGVTAAAVVWYLERFEIDRGWAKMAEYLAKHDEFRRFADGGGGSPA